MRLIFCRKSYVSTGNIKVGECECMINDNLENWLLRYRDRFEYRGKMVLRNLILVNMRCTLREMIGISMNFPLEPVASGAGLWWERERKVKKKKKSMPTMLSSSSSRRIPWWLESLDLSCFDVRRQTNLLFLYIKL